MKNRFCAVLLLLVSFSACVPSADDSAPEITGQLIDGTPFQLSELRGEYVVLDFWGSWCGPCLADIPKLMALHEKYGDQVTFVSIAFEKNDKRWRQVSEKAGFSWKHQLVEQAPVLLASSIARDYGVADIPAKFIVTPEGKLILGMNFEQMDTYLEATLGK
jgi:thiol-disulfide isomerase/thioredoxin